MSNGFDKNSHNNNEYEKNGNHSKHSKNYHSSHQKTQSEGGLHKGNFAQQLQLDQLQRERDIQQQQQQYQQQQAMHDKQQQIIQTNNSSSNEDYEYLEDEMPHSSDSEVKMFMQLVSPSNTSSPQRKKVDYKPREKRLFQGWKKLVNGQIPVDSDDNKEDVMASPPVPYQLEEHEESVVILDRFLRKIKQFEGVQRDLSESQLPSITEVNKEQRETIFVQKLYLCQSKCDFFDTVKYIFVAPSTDNCCVTYRETK